MSTALAQTTAAQTTATPRPWRAGQRGGEAGGGETGGAAGLVGLVGAVGAAGLVRPAGLVGAAVGGTVPNITTVVTSVNKNAAAGLIPAGVLGLANQYPELDKLLDKHVLPQHRDEFFRARRQCFLADVAQFNSRDVVAMFDDPGLVYTHPTAVRIVGLNNPGHHTPKTPLFVYKSTCDEISPVEETDALVGTYCAGGATVEYQRDIASDHQNLAILAAAKAMSWLIGAMNGSNDQRGCMTDTVISLLLDPAALEVIPKIIDLLDLLGKPVGPIIG